MKKERILSGMQSTGTLHIGNYFGALKQWVELQQAYDCFYCVVDLHALTIKQNPKTFAQQTLDAAMDFLAAGVDPKQSTMFIQSQVPEHAELMWLLTTLTPMGELERMTQYKEKSVENAKNSNAGLFMYPELMAADILLYKPTTVPVGEDQVQHVELTRVLARKFNRLYGTTFLEPKAKLTHGARIMSLTEPTKKMSKSHGEKNYIALSDEPDVIRQKISKAVTASSGGNDVHPGVKNLLTIMREVSTAKTVQKLEAAQQDGSIRYADFKKQLADDLIEHLAPFQKKRKELAKKPSYVKEVLEEGRKKASAVAQATMEEVRTKVGLLR